MTSGPILGALCLATVTGFFTRYASQGLHGSRVGRTFWRNERENWHFWEGKKQKKEWENDLRAGGWGWGGRRTSSVTSGSRWEVCAINCSTREKSALLSRHRRDRRQCWAITSKSSYQLTHALAVICKCSHISTHPVVLTRTCAYTCMLTRRPPPVNARIR